MKTYQHIKDYYKILGINENATELEIKKAYRKLAVSCHPDRNPDNPASEEKFKEITEAYGVLMDTRKRREYDQFRTGFQDHAHSRSGFDYTQQEIFENMFRQRFGQDAFRDLNREFNRFGFRSGTGFFEGVLFTGAVGTLGRLLRMIPGPIGKIGAGLWVLQSVGSALYTLSRSQSNRPDLGNSTSNKNKQGLFQNLFAKAASAENAHTAGDIHFQITITSQEAGTGVNKKISYRADNQLEILKVAIPAGIASGGKLRLRGRGQRVGTRRGDLLLTIYVQDAP